MSRLDEDGNGSFELREAHQPALESSRGRLCAIRNVKFFENHFDVVLHRVFSKTERNADLLVALTFHNQQKDLAFARS